MENKSGGKVINHGGILKRLSWFIGLWVGGVLTLTLIGTLIKAML